MSNPPVDLTTTDIQSASFLLSNVEAPFLIGLAVRCVGKKVLRLALLLAGSMVIFFFVSEYLGVIRVNGQGLQQSALNASELANQGGGFLLDLLSRITCKG